MRDLAAADELLSFDEPQDENRHWSWAGPNSGNEAYSAWDKTREPASNSSWAQWHGGYKDWNSYNDWEWKGYDYRWSRRDAPGNYSQVAGPVAHVAHQSWRNAAEVNDPGIETSIAALVQLAEAPEEDQKHLKDSHLADLLSGLQKQVQRSTSVSPDQLLTILRCLATLGCTHKPLLDTISSQVVRTVANFDPEEISTCVHAFAEFDMQSISAVEVLLSEALKHNSDYDLSQLSRLVLPSSSTGTQRSLLLQAIVNRVPEVFGADVAPPAPAARARISSALESSVQQKTLKAITRRATGYAPCSLVDVLWTLAILGLREGGLVIALCSEVSSKIGDFSAHDLATIVWALGTLGFRGISTLEVLAAEISRRTWEMLPLDLTKIAFGFAALGLQNVQMMEAIAEAATWKINQFEAAGFAQLAWAFATLAFPQRKMMTAIAVEASKEIERFDAAHLASIAWAFATLRLRHARLMLAVAKEAILKIADFDDEDLARVAWAFAALELAPPALTTLLVDEASKRATNARKSQIRSPMRAVTPEPSGRETDQRGDNCERRKLGIPTGRGLALGGRSASVDCMDAEHDLTKRTITRSRSAGVIRQMNRPRLAATPARDASMPGSATARQACEAPFRPSGSTTNTVAMEENEFPTVSASVSIGMQRHGEPDRQLGGLPNSEVLHAKKLQSEFKRLPLPGRVPQKKRKQKALEALRREGRPESDPEDKVSSLPHQCSLAKSGGASAAARLAEDDFDDDFEASTNGVGHDLLDEALGEDGEEAPSYDALLESLRNQLRKQCGDQLAERLTDQQVFAKADGIDASREDQEHLLKLLEARRLAEKVAQGRHRSKSAQKKKAAQDKKLERDYVKKEIKNAYSAEFNTTVRYYNSVAIRVAKGEKSVDAKTIATVAAAQEGRMQEKMTKEERSMVRRCA